MGVSSDVVPAEYGAGHARIHRFLPWYRKWAMVSLSSEADAVRPESSTNGELGNKCEPLAEYRSAPYFEIEPMVPDMLPSSTTDLRNIPDAALRSAVPEPVASLYHQAFEMYGALCLWSTREIENPSLSDVLDAASRLRREGNMASRRFAAKLEESCRAAL